PFRAAGPAGVPARDPRGPSPLRAPRIPSPRGARPFHGDRPARRVSREKIAARRDGRPEAVRRSSQEGAMRRLLGFLFLVAIALVVITWYRDPQHRIPGISEVRH